MTNNKSRARILWVYDTGDLPKVQSWFAYRADRAGNAVIMHHDDTGALSICMFDEEYEAGIIRCATRELAEAVIDLLPPDFPISEVMGGDRGRYL